MRARARAHTHTHIKRPPSHHCPSLSLTASHSLSLCLTLSHCVTHLYTQTHSLSTLSVSPPPALPHAHTPFRMSHMYEDALPEPPAESGLSQEQWEMEEVEARASMHGFGFFHAALLSADNVSPPASPSPARPPCLPLFSLCPFAHPPVSPSLCRAHTITLASSPPSLSPLSPNKSLSLSLSLSLFLPPTPPPPAFAWCGQCAVHNG